MLLSDVIRIGTRAAQPAANTVAAGSLYIVSDEGNIIERSSGAAWAGIGGAASSGAWTTVAHNAADYTANTGTFTVEAGDLSTYRYVKIGKTVHLDLVINTASVSGTPVELRIALPAAINAPAATFLTTCRIANNGVVAVGYVAVTAAVSYLQVRVLDAATTWSGTGNITIQATITFEVTN